MKLLVVGFFLVGILMVAHAYMQKGMKCAAPRTVYRYLPRSFDQEQASLPKVTAVFNQMFEGTDPLSYQS
jgi:hypothetical protein